MSAIPPLSGGKPTSGKPAATAAFDPGSRGTGVLSVDGRVLAQQKMEHTIPFLMALDESFDIGVDTRTPVDDSYKLPFRFTGMIDKLTYKIGHEQIAAEDRERMKRALATAHD